MATPAWMALCGFLLLGQPAEPGARSPKLPPDWGRLKAPAGFWLGQDGHDVAGGASPGPNDVKDIRTALGGRRAGGAVASGTVRPLGGGEWLINGPPGPFRAELVREPGASTAELFLEPYQAETGRPFAIALTFD